jgi:AbrB family looped-hinge helix DNA binding protein
MVNMKTTRLSNKGQVVIPKSVRDAHKWRAGQEFIVVDISEGVLLKEWRPFEETELDEAAGYLRYSSRTRSGVSRWKHR